MDRQEWLTHIRKLQPAVKTITEIQSEADNLNKRIDELKSGPLRCFYQLRHINTLFALAIIPYLFLFHLIGGKQLLSLYQLLSFDFALYKGILIFLLFLVLPISLYFVVLHGSNLLWRHFGHYDEKASHAQIALEEANKYKEEATKELRDHTTIPLYYLKSYSLKKFENYFEHHRADCLKEAINLFETERSFLLHQYKMFRFHGEKRLYTSYEQAVQFDRQA
ncbi:hypothetical protein [Bacillus sp. JCM 19041]|uniref:hypothetical protein n=1 Tax=Bacillus sp. JCM 19041 TaxID=1460637 RepID=UPI0006D1896C